MAGFSRVNGDLKAVAVYDAGVYTNTGVDTVSSGVTVQPQGPKLSFGTVTFTGTATPTGSDLQTAVDTVAQLATVHMYEINTAVGDNLNTMAMAIYPAGAWDFTNGGNLDVALSAALGYAVETSASATFTN